MAYDAANGQGERHEAEGRREVRHADNVDDKHGNEAPEGAGEDPDNGCVYHEEIIVRHKWCDETKYGRNSHVEYEDVAPFHDFFVCEPAKEYPCKHLEKSHDGYTHGNVYRVMPKG